MIFLTLLTPVFVFASTLSSEPETCKVQFTAVGKPDNLKFEGKGTKVVGSAKKSDEKALSDIAFQVDLNEMKTGLSLRDRHMKEKYLQVEKFPNADLKIAKLSLPQPLHQKMNEIPFEGELLLHGVNKKVQGTFSSNPKTTGVAVQANFAVNISDFAIDVPSFAGVTVADKVIVQAECDLKHE